MDDAVRDRCDAVLRDLDLLDSVQRHPMSLSGGQKAEAGYSLRFDER